MKRILVCGLLALAACAVDRSVSPIGGTAAMPRGPLAVNCNTANTTGPDYWPDSVAYPCADTIWVYNISKRPNADVQAGLEIWNGALGFDGLPVFAFRVNGPYNIIVYDSTPLAQFICGRTPTNGRVALFYTSSRTDCGGNEEGLLTIDTSDHDQVGALVAHELGHALGYQKHFAVDTVTGACVMAVPTTMNDALCENDAEVVYYKYNLTTVLPADPALVYVTGAFVSTSSVTLPLNATTPDTIKALQLPGHLNAATTGSDALSWSLTNVSPAGAVTLSSNSGKVTTIQSHGVAGTATVQATLSSSPGRQVGFPFNAGQTNVTVVPPPSVTIQGLFQTNQTNPVRRNQTCTMQANASGGNGTYTYQWYLNGVTDGTDYFQNVVATGTSFTVKVVVHSMGDSAVASKTVSVSSSGQVCI